MFDPIESDTNRYYQEEADSSRLYESVMEELDEMKISEVITYINDYPKLSDRVWKITQDAYRGQGIDNHIDDLLEELYPKNQEAFFDALLIWDKVKQEIVEFMIEKRSE